MRIAQWNYDRNNNNLDMELENRMLQEEAQEFKDGMIMYFEGGYDDYGDSLVEMVDAWCDFQFVLKGTVYKSLGSNISPDLSNYIQQEKYMYHILVDQFEIEPIILNVCLNHVITANEAKGSRKVNGKIHKGTEWEDPKELIKQELEASGVI
jgi:hypothetical protein